jgi:uncharacterized protein (TIGR03435 family)
VVNLKNLFILLLASPGAFAAPQSSAQAPAFDVASVKPSDPSQTGQDFRILHGALIMRNLSLYTIIRRAYDIQLWQISGPGWLDDVRFDIEAKTAATAPDDDVRKMLQSLLAERFGMKAHLDLKQQAVYFLTIGKNGPNFHEQKNGAGSMLVPSISEGPPRFPADPKGMEMFGGTMADLAAQVASGVKQQVIDKTGLTGRYDLRLDVTRFATTGVDPNTEIRQDPLSFVVSAFQDQLGLKLEAGKADVQFLVIESINRVPTAN